MKAKSDKQDKNSFSWLKEYQWQKGQSGNPKGRPKEKTMKEFAREFLSNMSEEARIKYLTNIDADIVWKMAEGNPKNDLALSGTVNISNVLTAIENDGQTLDNEGLEDAAPIQDSGQKEEFDQVQSQQSPETLPTEQMVSEHNT